MKSFVQWYQYKLLSPFNQPLTFNKACILSLLLHGALFLVLALVVHLFESPSLYTPPLVFDFVFAPAQDYDRSSLNRDDLKETFDSVAESQKEQPAETRTANRPEKKWARIKTPSKLFDEENPPKLENSDLPAIDVAKQTGFNKAAATATEQEEFSAEELVEPDFVPEEKNMFNADNQFIISAVAPTSLSLPKINVRQPDLFPAKIGMSPKQHKMLLKKFKKWSENLNRMDWPDSSIVWKHKGKVYSARLHHIPAKAETGIEKVLIEVSTKENGYQLSSEMRMKRLAFSNFAQFVDYWDPWVAIHNDVLNGRFHTNTTFSVSQARGIQPEFHGKVTTASYDIHTSGSRPFLDQQAVFLAGIETGVKEIRLPRTHLSFASDSTVSHNQVHAFSEEVWITFRGDGS
ncbi:MAG: cell envelope integrity protein TolA, partial [bacterium]